MKEKILLVDDDMAVRRMLFRLLAEEDYSVTTVASGPEAFEHLGQAKVDLVLLDLKLPDKEGWQTFERLTTENPHLPVIVITARPNQLSSAVASGAGALMEKPLDLQGLLRTMRSLLEEPLESRQARMRGRAEFHYLLPKTAEKVGHS